MISNAVLSLGTNIDQTRSKKLVLVCYSQASHRDDWITFQEPELAHRVQYKLYAAYHCLIVIAPEQWGGLTC